MRIVILISLLCYLSSCQEVKDPVFKSIQEVNIDSASLEMVKVSAVASFYNPNNVEIEVQEGDIEVYANGINLGQLEILIPSKIPAKKDFELPLHISFPPSKIFKKKGGILGSILSTALDRKLELEYRGNIRVEVLGISVQVPIQEFEELELKF